MEVEIAMKDYRRQCIVISIDRHKKKTEYKAFFHRWVDIAEMVSASLTVLDDHPGGVVRSTFALVEFEDGTVGEASVEQIRFIDGGEFEDFAWPEPQGGDNDS